MKALIRSMAVAVVVVLGLVSASVGDPIRLRGSGGPTDIKMCPGQTLTFTIVATGSPAPSYQWRKDGSDIEGATLSTYEIGPLTLDDSGTYDCVASNICGSATSAAAVVTVNTGPSVTIGSPSESVTATGPVTYTVTFSEAVIGFDADDITLNATGDANGTVQVTGSGDSYTVTISDISGNGTLGITVEDAAATGGDTGCASSASSPSATFIADCIPPVIASATVTPHLVAAGDLLQITVSATDANGVDSVTANGTALTYGDGVWAGYISASAAPGAYSVAAIATDEAGNSASNSSAGSYKTVPIVGATGKFLTDPVMSIACNNYLFRVWGVVSTVDTERFTLDDGSGFPITVVAPGYTGFGNGDYVSARGIVTPSPVAPIVTSAPPYIVK